MSSKKPPLPSYSSVYDDDSDGSGSDYGSPVGSDDESAIPVVPKPVITPPTPISNAVRNALDNLLDRSKRRNTRMYFVRKLLAEIN